MLTHSNDNVVPLVDAIVAYRNRLVERERQSSAAEFKGTPEQIERWLVEFAYQRITQEYSPQNRRATYSRPESEGNPAVNQRG